MSENKITYIIKDQRKKAFYDTESYRKANPGAMYPNDKMVELGFNYYKDAKFLDEKTQPKSSAESFVVLASLSIEILLKSLNSSTYLLDEKGQYIDKNDEIDGGWCSTEAEKKTHNLFVLFESLHDEHKNGIKKLWKEKMPSSVIFDRSLEGLSNVFTEYRYLYEGPQALPKDELWGLASVVAEYVKGFLE
jgi:hypothetical protein